MASEQNVSILQQFLDSGRSFTRKAAAHILTGTMALTPAAPVIAPIAVGALAAGVVIAAPSTVQAASALLTWVPNNYQYDGLRYRNIFNGSSPVNIPLYESDGTPKPGTLGPLSAVGSTFAAEVQIKTLTPNLASTYQDWTTVGAVAFSSTHTLSAPPSITVPNLLDGYKYVARIRNTFVDTDGASHYSEWSSEKALQPKTFLQFRSETNATLVHDVQIPPSGTAAILLNTGDISSTVSDCVVGELPWGPAKGRTFLKGTGEYTARWEHLNGDNTTSLCLVNINHDGTLIAGTRQFDDYTNMPNTNLRLDAGYSVISMASFQRDTSETITYGVGDTVTKPALSDRVSILAHNGSAVQVLTFDGYNNRISAQDLTRSVSFTPQGLGVKKDYSGELIIPFSLASGSNYSVNFRSVTDGVYKTVGVGNTAKLPTGYTPVLEKKDNIFVFDDGTMGMLAHNPSTGDVKIVKANANGQITVDGSGYATGASWISTGKAYVTGSWTPVQAGIDPVSGDIYARFRGTTASPGRSVLYFFDKITGAYKSAIIFDTTGTVISQAPLKEKMDQDSKLAAIDKFREQFPRKASGPSITSLSKSTKKVAGFAPPRLG